MVVYLSNDNLLSGIKGELARRLAAGEERIGVVCSIPESARDCLARAIQRTTAKGLRGDIAAQFQLSTDEYINSGVTARAWRLKAARNGSAMAQEVLGLDYLKNKRDTRAARYWLEKAARSNRPVAIYNLGYTYYNPHGHGIADRDKAFALFLRSARSGYNVAQLVVGVMLYKGWGTAMDRDGARSWIGMAAATGLVKARKFLRENY